MPAELGPANWPEIAPLLDEALDLRPSARPAWLAELAARRPDLHEALVRLLRADASAESEGFLSSSPRLDRTVTETEAASTGPSPGDRVGPYVLERELGRGGMGSVWLAARTDGTLNRAVALKLPHSAPGDRRLLERFDRERDILAGLVHPNVARLYDAGVTAEGQPFLALEYVDGTPLREYCDEHALGMRPRIELFLQVLDAVQYAHRNLVVHRDLKPHNVLVNRDGVAMLLDFGIAKLLETEGAASQATDVTRVGGTPLTPRYASPEQIAGGPVTTSSDVYSLGVILFELLSGRLPYRLKRDSTAEIEAAISSGDTVPPSRAVHATVPPPRGLPERKRLVRALRGDLDGVLLKALEKDPARRYPSAESFARDLSRWLRGEPVEARPHTTLYQARKFVARHRVGVGIAGSVALAILGSLGFALVQMRAAQRQRDRAEAVSSFLVSLFQVSDPNEAKGKTVTAREILDKGVAKIDDLKGEPLVQANLLNTMGQVYQNLGLLDSAQPLLERSLDLRRRLLGSDDYETMESINSVASLLWIRGKLDRAEPLFREALERRRRVLGPDHKDTLNAENNLALVLQQRGKLAEAEPLFRASLEGKRRTLKPDDADRLPPINNLANLLKQEGKYEDARVAFVELVESARRILGEDDPHYYIAVSGLGLVLQAEGDLEGAEARFRTALAGRERLLGKDHAQTQLVRYFLGDCLRQRGRLADAEPLLREAYDGLGKRLGPDHQRTLEARQGLVALLMDQGKLEEAEREGRRVLEARRAALGPDHFETIESLATLGSILELSGRLAEAEAADREAVERAGRALGDTHPTTILATSKLEGVLTSEGRAAEAEPVLARVVAAAKKDFPPTSDVVGRALLEQGRCLTALGKYTEAEAALLASSSILEKASTIQAPRAAAGLADLYARWGRPAQADAWRKRAAAGAS